MEHLLPNELVEKIYNINILKNHECVNAEFLETVSYHQTGYQMASGDNCMPKVTYVEYYELVVNCPLHNIAKRVKYANGSIDDNGMWKSILHVSTFLQSEKIGGCIKVGEQTMLDSPIDNNTTVFRH